jgi:hypothetical protein
MDERILELMNGEIDGTNSHDESRELRERLERDPEARQHFEELKSVGLALSEAGELSPPAWVKREVMREIEAGRSASHAPSTAAGVMERVRRALGPSPRLRPAFAFAGGVAVGLVLFAVLSATLPGMLPGDAGRIYGTIGGRCYVEESVSFDVPGGSGQARVRYCAETVTVGLSLSTESEVVVVLSYDDEVDYDGFKAFQPGDHALRVSGNRAELTHSGTRDYDLYFTDYTESHLPMRLRVMEEGRSVYESSVPPGRE